MRGNLILIIPILMIIESFIFFKISVVVGFWWAIFLLFTTGFIGVKIVGLEGKHKINAIARELQENGGPVGLEIFDSLVLLFAGFLIILPGFFTDCLGAALLVAPFRKLILITFLGNMLKKMVVGEGRGGHHAKTYTAGYQQNFTKSTVYESGGEKNSEKVCSNDSDIIEGEFHRKDK